MDVVDANVLLYAVNRASGEQHVSSRRWLDAALLDGTVGFATSTLVSFVRLATHPRVFPRPMSAAGALDVVDFWLEAPGSTTVSPSRGHWRLLRRLLTEAQGSADLVPDAHLAALAIDVDATVVSYDSDFGRFRELRWLTPDQAVRH